MQVFGTENPGLAGSESVPDLRLTKHPLRQGSGDDGEGTGCPAVVVRFGVLSGKPGQYPRFMLGSALKQPRPAVRGVISDQVCPLAPSIGVFPCDASRVGVRAALIGAASGSSDRVRRNGEHDEEVLR